MSQNRNMPSRAYGQAGTNQTDHSKRILSSAPGRHDASSILPKTRAVGPAVDVPVRPGTPVTGVATTDIFTSTNHGLVLNDRVRFSAIAGGAGITPATTTYFVIATNMTANTFQVSATLGGASIDTTTDLTAGTVTEYEMRSPQAGAWHVSQQQGDTETAIPNRDIPAKTADSQ